MGIVDRLLADRPVFHVGGTVRWDSLPQTLSMIEESVQPGSRTLETGCGASTVVFASGGAAHTVISPDAEEHRLVREYCARIGVDDSRLTFVAAYSEDVLPDLCRERIFDVAFIDGAHTFPNPAVDWYFIARGLKVGARLLMDDVPIPAVTPLYRHMSMEPNWRLDGILDARAAAFTMLALPQPQDWVAQPYNLRFPDLSFLPPGPRAILVSKQRMSDLRKTAARRYPRLRDAWKHLSSVRG